MPWPDASKTEKSKIIPQIKADVFPAIVQITSPDGLGTRQVHTARIIVTENRVIIAQDGPKGPELVFSQGYDPATLEKAPKRTDPSTLTTLNGMALSFVKDDACGCGSRLKSWNPFKGSIMSSKNPTE